MSDEPNVRQPKEDGIEASNLPDVMGIYARDFERHPRVPRDWEDVPTGLFEVDRIMMFSDGGLMLLSQDDRGRIMPGIVLSRDAVWAIKARG